MNIYCEHPVINAHVERLLPISHLLCDPNNEVSINGGRVWIDPSSGNMLDTGIELSEPAVHAAIRLLVAADGNYLDPAAPFATLTLACGARFHAALKPVSNEPRISIRRHPQIIRDFLDFGTQEQAELCDRAITAKKNLLLAGATSSGKTSCLNSLIAMVPAAERLAVVEEAPELIIRHANVIHGYASETVGIQRHIRELLRDRPDRIIVGEVRGGEAKDAVEAAATGHERAAQFREARYFQNLTRFYAAIIMATQSLAEIESSEVRSLLLESTAIKVFLPNRAAAGQHVRTLYEHLGLREKEIEIIAAAIPQRDYLCTTEYGACLFRLDLGPVGRALCASTGANDVAKARALLAEYGPAAFLDAWLHAKGLGPQPISTEGYNVAAD